MNVVQYNMSSIISQLTSKPSSPKQKCDCYTVQQLLKLFYSPSYCKNNIISHSVFLIYTHDDVLYAAVCCLIAVMTLIGSVQLLSLFATAIYRFSYIDTYAEYFTSLGKKTDETCWPRRDCCDQPRDIRYRYCICNCIINQYSFVQKTKSVLHISVFRCVN